MISDEAVFDLVGRTAEAYDRFDEMNNAMENEKTRAKLPSYRSISKNIFRDLKVRTLNPYEKLVFIFILIDIRYTQEYGVCIANVEEIASSLGLEVDVVEESLRKLESLDIILRDESTEEILIRNFFKYNWGRNNISWGYRLYHDAEAIQNLDFKQYVQEMIKAVTGTDGITRPKEQIKISKAKA